MKTLEEELNSHSGKSDLSSREVVRSFLGGNTSRPTTTFGPDHFDFRVKVGGNAVVSNIQVPTSVSLNNTVPSSSQATVKILEETSRASYQLKTKRAKVEDVAVITGRAVVLKNNIKSKNNTSRFLDNASLVIFKASQANALTKAKNTAYDSEAITSKYDVSNYQHTLKDRVFGQEEVSSFGKEMKQIFRSANVIKEATFYSNPDDRGPIKATEFTDKNVAGMILDKLDSESTVIANATNDHNATQFAAMAKLTGANIHLPEVQVHGKTYITEDNIGEALTVAGGNLSRSVFIDKGNTVSSQMAQINLGVTTRDAESIREHRAILDALKGGYTIPETKNFITSGPGKRSHQEFSELLETSTDEALIVTPFIDSRVMSKTVRHLEQTDRQVSIITNPIISKYKKGAGGHTANRLEFLAQAYRDGADIYTVGYGSLLNMHLKGVSAGRDKVASIGSDNITNKTDEGRSFEQSKVGLYSEELYEVFDDNLAAGNLINVKDNNDPSATLIKEMAKSLGYRERGVTNSHYSRILASNQNYFTLSASRGTSQHYQQSLYENAMKQGGYNNLARSRPFEGVAESLVKTNLKLKNRPNSDATTIFLAQQFDKGLYTSGVGEFLNNKLFIPNGFGRAYKDEKGFISSAAGFAGRMLDESYLYYSNINPDIHLIGNEYETGMGLGPMAGSKPGLFESTFSRAADYTVAMAQSLGMYVAITQPLEMLKASTYKDILDTNLTAASKRSFKGKLKLRDFPAAATQAFFFGEGAGPVNILERMFEVDRANNVATDVNGVTIKRKQTSFFDHNQPNQSGFVTQQFLTRGRAQLMLESTFSPFLKEAVNPFNIGAIDESTGESYYKFYNKAVDELIDSISAPAGLKAIPSSSFKFKNLTIKAKDVTGVADFHLNLKGGAIRTKSGTQSNDIQNIFVTGKGNVKGMEVILGGPTDPLIQDYDELQRQYNHIINALEPKINTAYDKMLAAKTENARKVAAAELEQLVVAKDSVKLQLSEAFETMSLQTTNTGVWHKQNVARKLQAVLDHTPLNPFKWGILGGDLDSKAGTVMIGQLFSFEDTARMAESAVTGDGGLNQIFRKAQTSKIAEMRTEEVNGQQIERFIRNYNLTDTVHASMQTFDKLNTSIFKAIKDFIIPDKNSKQEVINKASRQLRIAEQKTVAKKGFWQKLRSGWKGDYDEIDKTAMGVDKEYLHVKKRGTHILNAIHEYEDQLTQKYGIGLKELEAQLDDDGIKRLMRSSGEMSIQKRINNILQGKGANLTVEGKINNRAKGLIAGLVFASIAGNSIFQSTGGASLVTQAMFAVTGEKADIAIEYQGNRFLPTEMFHSAIENTFGAAPSILAMNTTAELVTIAGSLYLGHRLANKHTHLEAIQYSYSLDNIKAMQEGGEHIKIFKNVKNAEGKVVKHYIKLDELAEASKELASHKMNRGKLFIETLKEGTNSPIKTAVALNGDATVLTTKKILQSVVKDVPINTMIYASVAMLALGGLRQVTASTLQVLSQTAGDPADPFTNAAMIMGGFTTVLGSTYIGSSYIKGRLVDDILNAGDPLIKEVEHYTKNGRVANAQSRMDAAQRQIDRLVAKAPDPKKPVTDAQIELRRLEKIERLQQYKGRQRYIQERPLALENFMKTEKGVRYAALTDPDNIKSSLLRNLDPTSLTLKVGAIGLAAVAIGLYHKNNQKELDYSGSLDPLLGAAIGIGVGSLLARSPAVAVAAGVAGAATAQLLNWGGIKMLKIGKSGTAVDGDKARMISQMANFTDAVHSNLDKVNTFTISTSAYVSRFSNLADKGLYGKGENPMDKTRVIAKQVPLPFLQFFVAEKISGNYNTKLGQGFDNETTNRIYSVGVQTGALFGTSMSLQLPVMYTPGRGFMGFSYNPDHNLEKLPNAMASMAAYSNIFFGSAAVVSGLGAALPFGAGNALQNFSTGMGDFNKGVQSLARNVNGFYIEQVARTFVKLNLVDTQLLVQSVTDKVYEDSRLKVIETEVTQEIDIQIKKDYAPGNQNGFELRDAKGNAITNSDDLTIKKLSQMARDNNLDDESLRQLSLIERRTKANYFSKNNLGVVERTIASNRIGSFGTDMKSYGTNKAMNASLNFMRRHTMTSVKAFIIGATLTNLVGTAISNASVNHVGMDEDDLKIAEAKKVFWEDKKDLIMAGLGGTVASAAYITASEGGAIINKSTAKFVNQNPTIKNLVGTMTESKSKISAVLAIAATAAYFTAKTSEEFGLVRNMTKHISYNKDGSGANRHENGDLIYERNYGHQAVVVGALTAYTAGMFTTFGGPMQSYQQMSTIFYEEFEGKTPTNIVGKIWEKMAGHQRKGLAKLEIENLLGDVTRLQFNDIDEFKAFHNIADINDNPLTMRKLQQDINLYDLKNNIKEKLAAELQVKPSEVPNDFVNKYLSIHKKVKQQAAAAGTSLIDVTAYMDPQEADNYKKFMRAVNSGIQDFGTSNKGVFLRQNKFTRGLSTKIAVTMVAMATVRHVLGHFDNASIDDMGRPGPGGWLNRLYEKGDSMGTWGQQKVDGSGKVSFGEGLWAIGGDIMKIITGRDKVDIGVIAHQVNNRISTENIPYQKLIGTKADQAGAKGLITDIGAGFVFDDSNAYLQLGSFGGVTFRTGDKGFRTSSYFQLQSAGQDISTAAYTMAAKFYHKTIAGQGIELSNIIDASTRLIKDGATVRNLNATAVMIRNATSMETPIKNIRKVTKSKGSVKGDRLANLILAAREEAGRQMNQQSLSGLYTENYFSQVGNFQEQVGGNFFRNFMASAAKGEHAAQALLGEILAGSFGYNPGQRNIITSMTFFSGGKATRMKKNEKGENLIIDEMSGVDLTYQNEQFNQGASGIAEYITSSIGSLTNQGLLNFVPDFVKSVAGLGLAGLGVFAALSSAGSYAASSQYLDDVADLVERSNAIELTAHYDDGRAVNVSNEMKDTMNRAKGQMGDTLYEVSEARLLGTSSVPVHYITDGSELSDYVTKALEDVKANTPAGATAPSKSVNQILAERTKMDGIRGNRAVITRSDLMSNTTYRFQMSELIAFATDGQGTLDKISQTLAKNANYEIINFGGTNLNYVTKLTEISEIAKDFETALAKGQLGPLKATKGAAIDAFFNITKDEAIDATSNMNMFIKQRLMNTYNEMISEMHGGGMRADGSFDYKTNRFSQLIEIDVPGKGTQKITMFEMIHSNFEDADIIQHLKSAEHDIGTRLLQKYDGQYNTLDELIKATDNLDSIAPEHRGLIEEARQSLAANRLSGSMDADASYGARRMQAIIEEKINAKLSELGLEIDVDAAGKTTIKVNQLKSGGVGVGKVTLKPGQAGFDEVMNRIQTITTQVILEEDKEQLMQTASRRMAILQPETANKAGFAQRAINRLLGRQTGTNTSAVVDVAQFRSPGLTKAGLGGALAGLPVALEAVSIVIDFVAAANVYGAYARYAEALNDPYQTKQDEIMAQRELGMAVMKSGAAILMSIAQTKALSGIGMAWKKMKMTIPKALGIGVVGVGASSLGLGAFVKNTFKPVLKAAKVLNDEHGTMDKVGKAWNKTWNATVDAAGWTFGLPVSLVNKYGVSVIGEENTKKATSGTAGAIGGLLAMGTVIAGVAAGGGLFAGALAGTAAAAATVGAVMTAPVTLTLLGVALAGGFVAGWVFGDGNATASTKLLREIPKIPYIGDFLSSMIDNPYRAVRSQERFRHHYKHSPFTVGYAGDVVNQKWLAMLGTMDDPTGADLVSNMFGEIIRPTEYESSAWRINASQYGANPIPIVDGVIQRELRIRAQTYSDNMLGRYSWNQILENSDQGSVTEKRIKRAKAKEVAQLKRAQQNMRKAAQSGGATSVPSYAGGSNAAQNNLISDVVQESEIKKAEVIEEANKVASDMKNTKFYVSSNVEEVSNIFEDFTKDTLDITLHKGNQTTKIPGIEKKLLIAQVVLSGAGTPTLSVAYSVDKASGVVRDAVVNVVTEGQPPSPEQYSQGRVSVMNANLV